jgi:hypothetical protein
MEMQKMGEWIFILGVLVAVVLGLVPGMIDAGTAAVILVVIGLVIGFLNITEKETNSFLLAGLGLLVGGVAGLNKLPMVGTYVGSILTNIATFVAPAVVIVAVKSMYDLAKKK